MNLSSTRAISAAPIYPVRAPRPTMFSSSLISLLVSNARKKNFRQRKTDDGPTTLASIPVTLTDDLDLQSPANCNDPCTCRVSRPKVDQLPVQNLWRVETDGQTNGHDRSLYNIGSGGNYRVPQHQTVGLNHKLDMFESLLICNKPTIIIGMPA